MPDDNTFAAKMSQIEPNNPGDPESAHVRADEILCELLTELGYAKTVAAYEAIFKWHA